MRVEVAQGARRFRVRHGVQPAVRDAAMRERLRPLRFRGLQHLLPARLVEAQQCAAALTRMVEEHKPTDGTDRIVQEIERAISRIKVVSWDSIYGDRYN